MLQNSNNNQLNLLSGSNNVIQEIKKESIRNKVNIFLYLLVIPTKKKKNFQRGTVG
jgi:hypothetical protein